MRRATAALALLASLVALAGCGLTKKLTGTLTANQPPHTVLFVNGPVDTVNHIVHLYWFGSDADGSVAGFEWSIDYPDTNRDTGWRFTTNTDSVFTIPAPAGYTAPVFSVRAIDDEGARDPQPVVQTFQFRNLPPTVRLTTKPATTDTTFASVSVVWSANDPDGDAAKLTYHVWLDGRESTPEVMTTTSFTMPTERFEVNGVLTAGTRKLFVRAIDDGNMAGPVDSCVWRVRLPVSGSRARLLIVDDVPRTNAVNTRFDTLYSNSCARVGLTTSEYTILRLDTTQPFRTAADVAQTFALFDNVVWYRGNETSFSTVLRTAQDGIGQYVSNGGRFYLDGLYLFEGRNATGPLTEDFARRYLATPGLVRAFTTTPTFSDSSSGFGNVNPAVFLPHVDVNGAGLIARDSMYVRQVFTVRSGEAGGLRQFIIGDRANVLLYGAPGALTPAVGDSTAVGLSVAQPGGGRLAVVCMPPGAAVPPVGAGTAAGSAARFVTNLYRHFGLDRPPLPGTRVAGRAGGRRRGTPHADVSGTGSERSMPRKVYSPAGLRLVGS